MSEFTFASEQKYTTFFPLETLSSVFLVMPLCFPSICFVFFLLYFTPYLPVSIQFPLKRLPQKPFSISLFSACKENPKSRSSKFHLQISCLKLATKFCEKASYKISGCFIKSLLNSQHKCYLRRKANGKLFS